MFHFATIFVFVATIGIPVALGVGDVVGDHYTFIRGPKTTVSYEQAISEQEYHDDNQPYFRGYFALTKFNMDRNVIINGGVSGGFERLNNVWIYSVELSQWKRMRNEPANSASCAVIGNFSESNRIEKRRYHQGVMVDDEKYWVVFPGRDESNDNPNSRWMYSMELNQWTKLDSFPDFYEDTGIPGGRYGYGFVPIEEKIVVFNGIGYLGDATQDFIDDMWLMDMNDFSWDKIRGNGFDSLPVFGSTGVFSLNNTPGSMSSFDTVLVSEDEILTIGGNENDSSKKVNRMWSLNVTSFFWRYVCGSKIGDPASNFPRYGTNNTLPGGRAPGVSIFVNGEIVFGHGYGLASNNPIYGTLNDLWTYSVEKRSWKFVSRPATKQTNGYPVFPEETGVYSSDALPGASYGLGMILFNNTFALLMFGWGYFETGSPGFLGVIWKLDFESRCFDLLFSDPGVCSSGGECVENTCVCNDGRFGEDCSVSQCSGIFSNNTLVCSAVGICVDSRCACYFTDSYMMDDCSIDEDLRILMTNLWMIIVFPILGMALCILVCLAICALIVIITRLSKRLKVFGDIEDIDLILEEHKIEKQSSEKKGKLSIKINRSLFEVNFQDITLIQVLGNGGSNSTVFLVKWKEKYCAYKSFRGDMIMKKDNDFQEFQKEVEIVANCRHPNILSFFGACVVPPRQVGILLEYCKNGDLSRFVLLRKINNNPLTNKEKMRFLKEISTALDYLHSLSICHRDLKPENVLISDSISAKVMDFGLSKVTDTSSDKTQTASVGTSYFIAPEVLKGKYSFKIDVFSFAIIAHCVICDSPFPYGKSVGLGVMYKVARNPSFRPTLNRKQFQGLEFMKKFLERNWSHDPKDRNSFKEIVEFFKKHESFVGLNESEKGLKNQNCCLQCEQKELENRNLRKTISKLKKKLEVVK